MPEPAADRDAPTDGYRERPSRFGAGAVLWTSPGSATPTRVLPDGCMDLIWHEAADTLYVAGPDTRAHLTPAGPDAGWAGLRFAPGTAPALLGVPAHQLRDQLVPLGELLPSARARRLGGQIAGAEHRARALEEVALTLGNDAGPPDPLCQAMVSGLRAQRPVAGLAAYAGLSERQLYRRSLTAFGYGLRTLAKVLRSQRALELAAGGLPFAEVAVLAGYADQAHLARDVKALTGVTLTTLLTRERSS